MSGQIIGLQDWFETPPGRYLLAWEQAQFDEAVADIFGYHALQLGLGCVDGLRANRMPHRWLATTDPVVPAPRAAFLTDFAALPFSANSLDLVVLPHTLELSPDPHATLREVERVLVPEGRVVICGLNPASLWGMRQRRARLYQRLGFGELFLPEAGDFIGYWRLRDWLRLLSFEVESGRFGAYRPAVRSDAWLERCRWFDRAGERWWPIFGAVYFLVAVKRVRGMRLLSADWRRASQRASAPVPIAGRVHRGPPTSSTSSEGHGF
ncbi:class I SAM-dependent methyltransferase [Variovorax arabinosiphilus]|uniref:class I SAM-dependent methyltransferase n=1 Tax=Variovorax arabinosiphilus TaxID=3053498 RepID=UPI0025773DDF|nr:MULTISPECIES: methyltransferase domain-containing protein [unclassified Variovorax]MDM0118253.1 methyltransferase domain-containing protein [Variovorax sp. J2L1-78]MDM0128678.1 methyltransferase domain-containing protein [Variovorax sp. J2L1-63]MDM0233536.1 methyltransferase domain-containing protein [Variovorax sp. J2R1-6]